MQNPRILDVFGFLTSAYKFKVKNKQKMLFL